MDNNNDINIRQNIKEFLLYLSAKKNIRTLNIMFHVFIRIEQCNSK